MSATVRHVGFVLRGNLVTAFAAAGLVVLVALAIAAPWIVPYDPIASNVPLALQPPSAAHWAGTDQLGRDIFSRILMAARLDLMIAITAVGLSFVAGAIAKTGKKTGSKTAVSSSTTGCGPAWSNEAMRSI